MRRDNKRNRKIKNFNRDYHDKKFIKYLSIIVIALFILLLCVAIFYHIYNTY